MRTLRAHQPRGNRRLHAASFSALHASKYLALVMFQHTVHAVLNSYATRMFIPVHRFNWRVKTQNVRLKQQGRVSRCVSPHRDVIDSFAYSLMFACRLRVRVFCVKEKFFWGFLSFLSKRQIKRSRLSEESRNRHKGTRNRSKNWLYYCKCGQEQSWNGVVHGWGQTVGTK